MPARAMSISRSFSSRDQAAMRFRESGAIMISSTYRLRLKLHYIAPQQRPLPSIPREPRRNRKLGTPSKFADQLSGRRHFNVTLSIMESHLASAGGPPIGRSDDAREGVGIAGAALPRMYSCRSARRTPRGARRN